MAMMGSAVWSGRLALDTAHALTDRAGVSVRDELERAGLPSGAPLARQPVKACFEAHIEQGPVLEQKAKTIGIVTGVQHMSRHEVVVQGQEAHAGPTPMELRRDPIRVLADLLPALYTAAEQRGRDARLTFGFIETLPGSPNTVPGRLRFTVDIRHPDAQQYLSLREEMNRLVNGSLERHGLKGGIHCVWEAPGVSFDPACIAAVRGAATPAMCPRWCPPPWFSSPARAGSVTTKRRARCPAIWRPAPMYCCMPCCRWRAARRRPILRKPP
jgi:N-carbamoyl-L-amino-acid hydrolase